MVVFFSFQKLGGTGEFEYRLCALATVERKVRQSDLWNDTKLRTFTKYFNLLIKPSKFIRGAWEHFEPSLEAPASPR